MCENHTFNMFEHFFISKFTVRGETCFNTLVCIGMGKKCYVGACLKIDEKLMKMTRNSTVDIINEFLDLIIPYVQVFIIF